MTALAPLPVARSRLGAGRAPHRGHLWRALAAMLALAATFLAQAQTLDEIDVRTQGEMKVLRIRFNATVSYLQIVPGGTADFFTLRFELLAADDAVLRQTTNEVKRLPAADGLPDIAVGYSVEPVNRVKQLTVRLGQALAVQARQGPNARSIELLLRPSVPPAPPVAPESAAAPAPAMPPPEPAATMEAAAPEVEGEAQELMSRARAALAARDADAAVAQLNRLLKLPPNAQSMMAQELIGNAWELAGDPARARTEYALYLKLYPQAEGAARVSQRLAALDGGAVAGASAAAAGPSAAASGPAPPKVWSGSLSQYYYGGKAKSQSLVNIATGIDQATLSRNTESAIVTTFDVGGRFAHASGNETRVVLRGSDSKSLLPGGHGSNSIGAAYVERRWASGGGLGGLAVRAGRQSPIGGGLLGLFDGVSLAYPVVEGVRLDVMGGAPANALVSAPSERLFASVLEVDSFLQRWGGSAYVLDQTTQGITNRRALGTEVRYAGDRWSLNTLVDYDTLFAKLNALSVHGSYQAAEQTTITMLADQRRAPSLQLTNALISSGADSLQTLLSQPDTTLADVRRRALETSAIARQLLISAARPLGARWQMSADLRYSAVGALPAVDNFQATPATGAQYSLSAQLTGTNLYSKRDIHNFNVSIITTPLFRGAQLAYNNLTAMSDNDDLTIEPSIRYYTQSDKQDVKISRIGPGVRTTYRASRRGSLLGEVLYEVSRTRGPTNRDDSSSVFFYVGYRYELF
jgi:tetratricopeptide (TPR) repeat protein